MSWVDFLKTIEGYNRDDCLSAWRLRDWLEDRRIELEKKNNQVLPRPESKSGKPSLDLAAQIDEVGDIKARLLDWPSGGRVGVDPRTERMLAARADVGMASPGGKVGMVGILPALRVVR